MQQKNKKVIIGALSLLLLLSNSIWGVLYFNKAKDVLTKFEQFPKNIDTLKLIERDTIYKQYDKKNLEYLFKNSIVNDEFDSIIKTKINNPICNVIKANSSAKVECKQYFTETDTLEKEFEEYKEWQNFRRGSGTAEDNMVYEAGKKILDDIESKFQDVTVWGIENNKIIKLDSLYYYFDSLFEKRKELKEKNEETNLIKMNVDEIEVLKKINEFKNRKLIRLS
jgi:hypothetical protein